MARRLLLLVMLINASLSYASYQIPPSLFTQIAEEKQLPRDLLYAVALKETKTTTQSGKIVAWPWTLNYRKEGFYFKSRDDLYQAAKTILNAGDTNFDICVMQVNWHYHADRFASLYDALAPENCIRAAADYLIDVSNMGNRRTWTSIVGGYHNLNRTIGDSYAMGVRKICQKAGLSCYSY